MKFLRNLKLGLRVYGLEPYFCFWTKFVLRRWSPRVILVTGSSGKTSLIHILGASLGDRALVSYKANTPLGVAFHLVGEAGVYKNRWRWLKLFFTVPIKSLYKRHGQEFYLVEFDAPIPRSDRYLRWWLKPEIAIWTSLSTSHSLNFTSKAKSNQDLKDLIAQSFGQVAKTAHSLIYAKSDDKNMRQALKDCQTKVCWLKDELIDYEVTMQSSRFKFKGGAFLFGQPQPKELSWQLTATLAVCREIGQPVVYDLRSMDTPASRSNYFAGLKGCHLIDSVYNAQPDSTQAILRMFGQIDFPVKWLVLGDLIDQGDLAGKVHRQVAQEILDLKPQKTILLGRNLNRYCLPILRRHRLPTLTFANAAEIIDHLKQTIKGQELILFKGSGYLFLVLRALLAQPKQAALLHGQQVRLPKGYRL